MNVVKQFRKHIIEAGLDPDHPLPIGRRQTAHDFLNGHPARKFPGPRPAHAVAHGENEILMPRGRLADAAEVLRSLGVELEAEERILVI